MHVVKRNGHRDPVSFDKITRRIQAQCHNLTYIDPIQIAQEVIQCLHNLISTAEIDNEVARICASKSEEHPDFGTLASRMLVSNYHRNNKRTFSEKMRFLFENVKKGIPSPIVSEPFFHFVQEHAPSLDAMVQYEWDYRFDYFGLRTLEHSYLQRRDNVLIESPQDMLMRVSVFLFMDIQPIEDALTQIRQCYEGMAAKEFIHATPTLFNAGTKQPQLLSCFLGGSDDSVDGIFKTLHRCAMISKFAGGIGLSLHNIRGKGSYIHGNNGHSDGLVPMCRVFNETARYVNQASKRKGSIAVYLEPDHPDIMAFLELKRNNGSEHERSRYLFYGLMISDLFMQRVNAKATWSLFDPAECPELQNTYGEQYKQVYEDLERQARFTRQLPARDVWKAILVSQIETGVPYLLYKDHINSKNNQANLGVIRNSNLCAEIVEYSDSNEYACCTLASIGLPSFVQNEDKFNFERLRAAVKQVVRNLNRAIDLNLYPVPETERSNLRHRPLGIGVQGLADVFAMMKLSFQSPRARELNRLIFEHMYFAAMEASVELAQQYGPYESFAGSPLSQGLLQCDLWGQAPQSDLDWAGLRERVKTCGARNSLLIALMPTASTSQILGFNECFEPFTSNIYTRRTLAGEFVWVNKYLVQDLLDLDLWTASLRQQIIAQRGSVQDIKEIPLEIRHRYATVWEISQRDIIDMAADRAPFVCQTQSMNLFMSTPSLSSLTAMHFYSWSKGLKTGQYYLRTKPVAHTQQFTVDPQLKKKKEEDKLLAEIQDTVAEKYDVCTSCSA
jgi:ribonucleoside-diphosphate reductase alpha subunit